MKYARVVELVDSLDSGSSAHSGRGGSTPPSRTREKGCSKEQPFVFCVRSDGGVEDLESDLPASPYEILAALSDKAPNRKIWGLIFIDGLKPV